MECDLRESRRGGKKRGSSLSIYRSRDADYGPAFALALLHDSAQARKILAELRKRYPDDTSVQFSYLPALRALEALNPGDPAKALELTQAAAPYDLAVPGTAFYTGAFLRSSLSGIRAWPCLFPDGASSRSGGGVSEDSRSSGDHAERSDRTDGASAIGQGLGRFRRSREIARLSTETSWRYGRMPMPDLPAVQQARAEYGR